MIQLATFPPAFGLRNVSPFCLKTEMLLTSLQLPFELVEEADPRKAPKAKLPYLIVDGEKIADSELITQYLDQVTQGQVYADLSAEQKAQGTAVTRLAEDHLYWMLVASRWLDSDWWPNVVEGFFGFVPKIVRPLITRLARKQVAKTYDLQGLGRHTLAEQKGFAERDLAALEALVGHEGYLFGQTPNIFDFTVASLMAGIYDNQPATWLTEIAQSYNNLKTYTERVQAHVGVYGREAV